MSDRELPSASERIFNWTYRFEDNTRLVGKARVSLESDRDCPIATRPLEAQYLDTDGKTVLIQWQDRDFIAFEMDETGEDLLIVASNDNCTNNSLCLVSGISRSRAQITDEGLQVVGESFHFPSWALNPEATANEPALSWGWSVSPFFPFLSLRVNLQSSTSKKIYRWTVSPYLPFFPLVEVAESIA